MIHHACSTQPSSHTLFQAFRHLCTDHGSICPILQCSGSSNSIKLFMGQEPLELNPRPHCFTCTRTKCFSVCPRFRDSLQLSWILLRTINPYIFLNTLFQTDESSCPRLQLPRPFRLYF